MNFPTNIDAELSFNIARGWDYDEIVRQCQTNTAFARVCVNDKFWRDKVKSIPNHNKLLKQSIQRGWVNYVKVLLEQGMDASEYLYETIGKCTIHYSDWEDHFAILKLLVKYNEDIKLREYGNKSTFLYLDGSVLRFLRKSFGEEAFPDTSIEGLRLVIMESKANSAEFRYRQLLSLGMSREEIFRQAADKGQVDIVQFVLSSPRFDVKKISKSDLRYIIGVSKTEIVYALIEDGRFDLSTNNNELLEYLRSERKTRTGLRIRARKQKITLLLTDANVKAVIDSHRTKYDPRQVSERDPLYRKIHQITSKKNLNKRTMREITEAAKDRIVMVEFEVEGDMKAVFLNEVNIDILTRQVIERQEGAGTIGEYISDLVSGHITNLRIYEYHKYT